MSIGLATQAGMFGRKAAAAGGTVAGLNFRSSDGYVTDGADEIRADASDTYPTTKSGITYGFTDSEARQDRDRSSSVDRRLAGIMFFQSGTVTLRLDVTPGTYDVRLAMGDALFNLETNIIIRDNTTARLTIANQIMSAGTFKDASGDIYTAANWPSSNTAVSVDISSGILIAEMTQVSFSRHGIAHLSVS